MSAEARLRAKADATKQSILSLLGKMDCFAALAMTLRELARSAAQSGALLRAVPTTSEARKGTVPGSGVKNACTAPSDHAAFLFSARLASCRKISVVPYRRSSGVSQTCRNTTFMSGRTLAALPCWRMK